MYTSASDGPPLPPPGTLRIDPVPAQSIVWHLPHRPQSAGTARRAVAHVLQSWGASTDTVDRTLLVTCELVTNALQHALPPVRLRLTGTCGEPVHLEVTDGGPADPNKGLISSGDEDEHGRGGTIIDFLATDHGTRPEALGSTHWADVPWTS